MLQVSAAAMLCIWQILAAFVTKFGGIAQLSERMSGSAMFLCSRYSCLYMFFNSMVPLNGESREAFEAQTNTQSHHSGIHDRYTDLA